MTRQALLLLVSSLLLGVKAFDLSIIHVNDLHDKFEPVNMYTGICRPGENEQGLCYGGLARMVTKISELQNSLPNPVLLNAGDSFQGSLLYSLFKWNVTVELMNHIPFHATALGNHEFDDGIAGVVPYMVGLNSPIVAANIDDSAEPDFQGKYERSLVLSIGGRQIGIIGCITKYTPEMASSEGLVFLDEVAPVAAEAARLKALGVDILILLSHSGYDVDQVMAEQVPDLDVIVGGHSHSFLYTDRGSPPPSIETVRGEYPTVVNTSSGRQVLVVQAYAHSKYVGALSLQFDDAGEITSYTGNPHILDSSVLEDPATVAAVQPWVDEANLVGNQSIGTSLVLLSNTGCYDGECSLGSFVTDSMVDEQLDVNDEDPESWTRAAIGIMNSGGIRAPLGEVSVITFNDLIRALPFADTVDTIELLGQDLLEVLELAATPFSYDFNYKDFGDARGSLQVSGMRVSYNFSSPVGSRVSELLLRCARCRVPELSPVVLDQWYTVALPSYLSGGGGGYALIAQRGRNKVVGRVDVDVMRDYISKQSPIIQGRDGRIVIL